MKIFQEFNEDLIVSELQRSLPNSETAIVPESLKSAESLERIFATAPEPADVSPAKTHKRATEQRSPQSTVSTPFKSPAAKKLAASSSLISLPEQSSCEKCCSYEKEVEGLKARIQQLEMGEPRRKGPLFSSAEVSSIEEELQKVEENSDEEDGTLGETPTPQSTSRAESRTPGSRLSLVSSGSLSRGVCKIDIDDESSLTDSQFRDMVGLDRKVFQILFEHTKKPFLEPGVERWRGPKVYRAHRAGKSRQASPTRLQEQELRYELFIALFRLRNNPHLTIISVMFGYSVGKISEIFHTWLLVLNEFLVALVQWPTKAEAEQLLQPEVRELYPGLIGIVDCSEIFIQKPQSLEAQSQTWSNYKHHNTLKFLIMIRGDGAVSFVSSCYPGSASDQQIFKEQLGPVLRRGDVILADRGFKVADFCRERGAKLHIPPSKKEGLQLTDAEVRETNVIANVRVHVERQIGYIKNWRFLSSGDVELRNVLLIDAVLKTVCGLVNLHKRIM